MTEMTARSTEITVTHPYAVQDIGGVYFEGWRFAVFCITLALISSVSKIDRILPFIRTESIKADRNLSDTQMSLLTGLAFVVCYTLLSLPLARAADRGSPRFVLVSCILIWSVMTALGGFAASFVFLALSRFGVAFGEAGAIPAGHALIARKVRPERRGLVVGLFAMGVPLRRWRALLPAAPSQTPWVSAQR
ncbi:MAG TPA: MFS transporter [Kaistia sp.]|nr:MFS transporter [Kaistia sp.]